MIHIFANRDTLLEKTEIINKFFNGTYDKIDILYKHPDYNIKRNGVINIEKYDDINKIHIILEEYFIHIDPTQENNLSIGKKVLFIPISYPYYVKILSTLFQSCFDLKNFKYKFKKNNLYIKNYTIEINNIQTNIDIKITISNNKISNIQLDIRSDKINTSCTIVVENY